MPRAARPHPSRARPSFLSPPLPPRAPRARAASRRVAPHRAAARAPDAGLTAHPGVTGTVCANLFPLPVLGAYAWFLGVYRRAAAADAGAFEVRVAPGARALRLAFAPALAPAPARAGDRHRAFRGVVTGNFNVADSLRALRAEHRPYALRFFDAGPAELFFQRRNEVHVLERWGRAEDDAEPAAPDAWEDPAPTYAVTSRTSSFEVRRLYPGMQASPRRPPKFEYFAMNLNPIFPLAEYSCFVCVWKQRNGTSPVAIDKRARSLHLSSFDPLELPSSSDSAESLPTIGTFAVKTFSGAVTDSSVAAQHKLLLGALDASFSIKAVSETDFRIVVDNTPNTLTTNRRNEIWIQVSE